MTGLPGSDLHGGKQNRRQSGKECERMPQSTKLSTAFLATVILYLAFMFLPLLIPQMDSLPSWATMAAGELLIMVPSLIYVKKNGKDTRRMIPHRRLTIGTVCCLIVFVPAVSPLVSFFNYVTTIFFGNTAAAAAGTITSMPVWAGVLLMAVLPAYCEEFVFRGIFFRGYRRHGFYAAALVSALYFGMLHMNWNQFSYAVILGIVFVLLEEASGTIYAPMLVHFGINFQSVAAMASYRSASDYAQAVESSSQLLYGSGGSGMLVLQGGYLFLAALFSAGICALLIYAIARINSRTGYMVWMLGKGERAQLKQLPKEKLFSVPMAAAIVICIGFMCWIALR